LYDPFRKQAKDDDESGSDPDDLSKAAQKIATMKMVNKDNERQGRPSSSASRQGPPPTGKTRVWHDRTGQFRVEAEFKGYENGKIRLHKLNGVIIEVPSEKMSAEDMRFIEKVTGADTGRSSKSQDDDGVPLSSLLKSKPAASSRSEPSPVQKKRVDWFKFFLDAGCDMDDCTRYDQAFVKDKIDDSILPDMKTDTLRALGLREGDIIRVMKAIEKRNWTAKTRNEEPGVTEQIQADEQYARQVQQAILTGGKIPSAPGPIPAKKPSSPAPNLFAGPNGTLKDNTRRGRPTPNPARSTSINVDENMLASATTQLVVSPTTATTTTSARTPSPNLIDAGSTPSSAVSKPSGFDDDAWTPRPSSTNPTSPVIAVTPPVTSSSAPPGATRGATPAATTAPVTATIPTVAVPEAPARPSTTSPTTAALSTELELLQKIADLRRPPSAPVTSIKPAAPPVPSPSLAVQTTQAMSPLSMATLQPQQTGFYSPTPPLANGVRGPFAPVPANEAVLLKPLVPTNTGMVGFVPTRPTNGSMVQQPLMSQQTGFQMQPTGIQVQPTGFQSTPTGFQSTPTGFQPTPTGFQPTPTGFQPTPSLIPQATGFGGFSPLTTQPTGFQYGLRSTPSPIPPVPSIPSQFTASNYFSFMKSAAN
jgi:actin cytoskeleton-regulatory complex protein SLA1